MLWKENSSGLLYDVLCQMTNWNWYEYPATWHQASVALRASDVEVIPSHL